MIKLLLFIFMGLFSFMDPLIAQEAGGLNIDLDSFTQPNGFSATINLLLAMSAISLVPFILVSTTAFLRIVIVLSMIRQALQTQQSPPNPVLIGLALFMTIFVMTPTFNAINESAIKPYREGKITQKQAYELGVKPHREFMLKFTREKDLALFLEFSKLEFTNDYNKVPIYVIIPAYVISELKAAFQIGFLLFIPFIVIDLIISNILLSLGMFMLSPAMVSLPFKILLFVLTDGWNLVIRGLLISLSA